ncbi:MAG: DUF5702 domain-containing protein [Lachnospiraceae bacterium]|nr:DUF5702 domain-containing protein [Lachnospiraceae bacterium]
MRKRRYQGSITIFLSLITVLFLAVICTVLEGIRIQGAKVRAAACLDMGLFSVFGEYDRELLSRYHVFFFDGSYRTGSFDVEKAEERLCFFMGQNNDLSHVSPGIDWFKVNNTETRVIQYFLATDEGGKAFLQQAALFMQGIPNTDGKSNQIGVSQGEEIENKIQIFRDLYQKLEYFWQTMNTSEKESYEIDPIEWIAGKRKGDVLQQVIPPSFSVSSGDVSQFDRVSERACNEGTMEIPTGDVENLEESFLRYLFFTFGNAKERKAQEGLAYELEYLLEGQNSDEKNLRKVCEDLLEIRFADNFLTVQKDQKQREKAEKMIMDWKEKADETEKKESENVKEEDRQERVTQEEIDIILLACAYQESCLDLQILLQGGRVPVEKNVGQWKVTEIPFWQNDVKILGAGEDTDGWTYQEYLQLLFEMRKVSDLPMKALDLVEWELRSGDDTAYFRADCCIGGMTVETAWQIEPMFFRVTSAFLGTGYSKTEYEAKGSFCYEMEE